MAVEASAALRSVATMLAALARMCAQHQAASQCVTMARARVLELSLASERRIATASSYADLHHATRHAGPRDVRRTAQVGRRRQQGLRLAATLYTPSSRHGRRSRKQHMVTSLCTSHTNTDQRGVRSIEHL